MPKSPEQIIAEHEGMFAFRQAIFNSPSGVAKELFDIKYWPRQAEMLEAPWRHHLSSWGTGHKVGKTESISAMVILWLLSHWPAKVIIIGPDWAHVTNVIFQAIATKAYIANDIAFRKTGQRLFPENNMPLTDKWVIGPEWWAQGFSPDKAEAVQGKHSKGINGGTLAVVDEASSLTVEVHRSLMSYADDPRNSIIYMGNLLHQDGPFADIHRQDQDWTTDWNVNNISSEDVPNVVETQKAIDDGEITIEQAREGKEKVIIPGLARWKYPDTMEKNWGRNSTEYQIRVLGVVPSQSEDTFISRDLVQGAINREPTPDDGSPVVMVCDPAWSEYGDESGIIGIDPDSESLRYVKALRGWKIPQIAPQLKKLSKRTEWNAFEIRIEIDGIGADLFHLLQGDQKNHREFWQMTSRYRSSPEMWVWPCPPDEMPSIVGIHMGGRAHDASVMANMKAEAWVHMKRGLETLRLGGEHGQKFLEIANVRFDQDERMGRFKLESKKAYRGRTGRSPTFADCLAIYYARKVGDPLFKKIGEKRSLIQMKLKPKVYGVVGFSGETEEWKLNLDGYPSEFDESGVLWRSMWYDRRGTSAVVWVHVDEDACRTVFECETFDGKDITHITRRMCEMSMDQVGHPHRYKVDVCCGHEASTQIGRYHSYIDDIYHVIKQFSKEKGLAQLSVPMALPAHTIRGTAGLDALDSWIEANGPDNPKGHNMLCVFPLPVVSALEQARLKAPGPGRDPEDYESQDAYGGGGSIVLALRLLAIEGGHVVAKAAV